VKTIVVLSGLVVASILAACSESQPGAIEPPPASARTSDGGIPARVCLANQGPDRTLCVVMLGAQRTMLADRKIVCSPVSSDDLSDTYAVMQWIRDHPEAQDDDLSSVIERVLKEMHPCA
jgi:hypothetical protein